MHFKNQSCTHVLHVQNTVKEKFTGEVKIVKEDSIQDYCNREEKLNSSPLKQKSGEF